MLFAHIVILVFQLPLRELVVDTTYWRDILLVLTFAMWVLLVGKGQEIKRDGFENISRWVKIYLTYGLIVVVSFYAEGNSFERIVRDFRNHFFPFVLFFVSRMTFNSDAARMRLYNFLYVVFIFLILNVFLEQLARYVGIPNSVFPWYNYQFSKLYRFIGNTATMYGAISADVGYVNPEDSPILGILGWPHATSAFFMALFAVLIPFMFLNKRKEEFRYLPILMVGFRQHLKDVLFVLSFTVLIVLGVRTQIVTIALVILMLNVLPFKLVTNKRLFYSVLLFIAVVGTNPDLLSKLLDLFDTGFRTDSSRDSTLAIIFSRDIIVGVFTRWLQEPFVSIILGSSEAVNSIVFQNLEIRLLYFTLLFGLLWLVIFSCLFGSAILHCVKIFNTENISLFNRLFALGCLLMSISYAADMLHYSYLMYFPNIDLWAISIGALSRIRSG
ncbi:hypothetical protein D4R75_08100 [bacterium]|nr:MAG: hypothetical protein D4R75_08100 [bacterium]